MEARTGTPDPPAARVAAGGRALRALAHAGQRGVLRGPGQALRAPHRPSGACRCISSMRSRRTTGAAPPPSACRACSRAGRAAGSCAAPPRGCSTSAARTADSWSPSPRRGRRVTGIENDERYVALAGPEPARARARRRRSSTGTPAAEQPGFPGSLRARHRQRRARARASGWRSFSGTSPRLARARRAWRTSRSPTARGRPTSARTDTTSSSASRCSTLPRPAAT